MRMGKCFLYFARIVQFVFHFHFNFFFSNNLFDWFCIWNFEICLTLCHLRRKKTDGRFEIWAEYENSTLVPGNFELITITFEKISFNTLLMMKYPTLIWKKKYRKKTAANLNFLIFSFYSNGTYAKNFLQKLYFFGYVVLSKFAAQ